MKNYVIHKSETRGRVNFGWLQSFHTFSFGNYYDPERIHFGALRVINDDTVAAGRGFDKHPHDNMEIISIPLEGDLEHKDTLGNIAVIKQGDIQVMSAGTGIQHSEYNKNKDRLTKFLQIWIFPNKQNVAPRYDQRTLRTDDMLNQFRQILSPNENDEGVWIHQDAWFHLGKFDEGITTEYKIKSKGNGIYAFIINGKATIAGQELRSRDGFGIWDVDSLSVTSDTPGTEILLMEVPMKF
ncbi:pirin family protein [Porphyromonas gulae]|uniref:Pirin n=1 Tax=Porphyromonas gulae TaxID=111105 RepID=A0A0A2FCR5_9PORP|nr:pirin family protein [Porphyromonas gulae]KGN69177.1 pirin [Porphyromonas gulae]KGN87815.1 pirin [Porphyromonas gulae]KKC51670.1 pirin [Porphyromonas gulae]